jgi:glycyl-tRNA synthetase
LKGLALVKKKLKSTKCRQKTARTIPSAQLIFITTFRLLAFQNLTGLAYRTDYDLKNHQEKSGKNLEYRPKDGSEPFIPHVIEPTFGLDRHVMAVISNAYTEDEVNGEKRVFLKLPAHLAPVKVAVSPLLKNKPELVDKAREVYQMLKKEFGAVMWDDNGNIGKRYRRQDEIGTPYCVTIDFQTLEDNTVTVRNRDTTEQAKKGWTARLTKLA